MPNAIAQIHQQLMNVLGGTNPNQYFTMLMPGTVLNPASYAFDTTGTKPQLVAQAESLLVDQLFDVANVTGSTNGERLSLQYMQALSVLVPVFDPVMPQMKSILRDYINTDAPDDAKVDGVAFKGNLAEYYFALYEGWLKIKSAWDTDVQDQRHALSAEDFLEWFEGHADGRLAQINAAFGRLLAVFSPADMEAILGALQAGPGGQVEEALAVVRNIRLPSPSGGYLYPVDLTPNDWFLGLASDMNPVDLLKDPEFIAVKISARRQAVAASIAQVKALLAQVPSKDELAAAANKLSAAQSAYTQAQDDLINTYAANTVTAVEMYLDAKYGGGDSGDESGGDDLGAELEKNIGAIKQAKGESGGDDKPKDKSGAPLSKADLQKLLNGQKQLVAAQSTLLSSSQALADAGMNLASEQSHTYGELPVMLARLQSQLEALNELQGQVQQSAAATRPEPKPLLSAATKAAATTFLEGVEKGAAALDGKSAAEAKTALDKLIPSGATSPLQPVSTAIDAAAGAQNATADDVLQAAKSAASELSGDPASKSSATSQRFMELQFAFETSSMEAKSSDISSSSQTSFSVDLFFGSASGSSSSSKAVSTKNSIDSSTCIEVGFKATKVDVSRGWFDPGIFKLSSGMNRLTKERVSAGSLDMNDPDTKAADIAAANEALLPSFPTAFVIAKDVTIRFKATESSLDALHSVMDSRSAVGGGFLCFSASHSSASHSDESSLSTRSEDTVITINMPGPQILGWFMEFTPADRSTPLELGKEGGEELSIVDFVDALEQQGDPAQHVLAGARMLPRTVRDLAQVTGLRAEAQNGCAKEHADH